jgi:hypothetical protein
MRLILALLLSASALLAEAQPVLAPEAKAVREVIEAQIDAFRRDDAERAFSYAAPEVRKMFGTPERFMEMVRSSYAVVYRPHAVTFKDAVRVGTDIAQPVRMTDGEGRAWLVVYPMERQPDGSWRINGCQLGRLPGQET